MTCNRDGDKAAWFRGLIDWETEDERTPAQRHGLDLINFHGVIVTRETAAEAQADLEAA